MDIEKQFDLIAEKYDRDRRKLYSVLKTSYTAVWEGRLGSGESTLLYILGGLDVPSREQTIIMVTHSPEAAGKTGRVITGRDAEIAH